MPAKAFAERCYDHLKETEFRFHHRRDTLYQVILKPLRLPVRVRTQTGEKPM